ncbi:MAK5 [Candida jiufengensis]|uniref:MAK5 n=1 Tax=Candida jiufengensis TaxID=497108 RepID=UPI002224A5BC|nr:MAK5 [Candida jiufengensis]KAI5951466.1 MAK5 [Candida jiufengensis]
MGKNNKKQSKVSKPQNKKSQQKRKIPTLKQKLQKESKIVKLNDLAWKPVEIPDNLGDYTGFFGLEEIDGVDVEIIDGKAQFVMKEDGNKSEEKEEEQVVEEDNEMEVDEDDQDDQDDKDDEDDDEILDDEEFTGFDDDEVTEEEKSKPEIEKVELNEEDDDELKHNTFANLDLPLPDDVNLPQWELSETKLSPYTLNGLSKLKFQTPTPIQSKTIPIAISGKDIIGKATTGSGKTLAYGIPILEKYLNSLPKIKENITNKIINHPVGIIFTPTRELAHQVVDHLTKLAEFTPLSSRGIVSVTGGLSIQKQQRLLKFGPGIIVATPGRMLELISNDDELCKRLSLTDIIVLDEADRLLQEGHFEEFAKILELFGKFRVKTKDVEWKWQTLVFSATFSKDLFSKLNKQQVGKNKNNNKKPIIDGNSLVGNDEIIELLNEKLKFKDKKPILIDANPKEIVSGQITEALVECGALERDLYLYYFLLMYKGTTLVFANSIDSVKRLVPLLNNLKIPTFAIHSSMIQKQRLRSLEKFKEAASKNSSVVLVASDVAARGLDIPNIDHVAHYHLPRSADVYIHRSGRTARAGKEGVSVMFCSPQEASGPLRKLRKLVASNASGNKKLNVHNDVKLLPIEMDLIGQLKPRIELAGKLADANVSSTATRKEDSWVKQAAEDLGVEDLHDLDEFEDDIIKKQRKRKEGKSLTKDEQKRMRYELNSMISIPIRKNNRRSYLTSGFDNLAHQMITGNYHEDVIGHEKVNALKDLQKNGNSIKSIGGGSTKMDKIIKINELKQSKKDAKKEAKQKRQQLKNGRGRNDENEDED